MSIILRIDGLLGNMTGTVYGAQVSGASVLGDQAPVRLHQGALSRAEEKHCAAHHAVCAIQHLDGSTCALAEGAGISATANNQRAAKEPITTNHSIARAQSMLMFHHTRNIALCLLFNLGFGHDPLQMYFAASRALTR